MKYKWTVEFEVDESWVADGFNLTDMRALEMLRNDLGYAYEHELMAKVIKAPSPSSIATAQGYTNTGAILAEIADGKLS